MAGSKRSVCKLRKTKIKENCCIEFKYSIKRAREIRKFYFAVVQRRLKSCCFANTNLLLFSVLFAVDVAVALLKLPIVVIQKF